MSNIKKVKKVEKQEEEVVVAESRSYYPDIAYNKSKKVKFFSLVALLVLTMGLFVGAMAAKQDWSGAIVLGLVLVVVGMIIPSLIKSYPTKPGVPEITISGHDVILRDRQIKANEIEKIVTTILLSPVSKLASENKQYVLDVASEYPEEPCFGTLDIYLKPGPKVKKGETIYLTIEDVLTATSNLVTAGVKHYSVFFSLKKIYEPAKFPIIKKEKQTVKLSDVSEKERLKQII